MYKLSMPAAQVLEDYYNKYAPIVKTKVIEFLNDGRELNIVLGSKHRIELIVKIQPDSTSFIAIFLRRLLDDSFLRKILIGNGLDVVRIIVEIKNDGIDNFKKVTKSKYPNKKDKDIIEDFYAIIHEIFVNDINDIYDGKINGAPVFDKSDFIHKRNLRVCPYCGASDIYVVDTTAAEVKPQIDHFLPKSKYPFLALNYYNLIPSCNKCNMIPNKGDKDPYSEALNKLVLQQPYLFDSNLFKFKYSYNLQGEMDPENYSCSIDYNNNQHLRGGYNDILAIESLYVNDKSTIQSLWRRASSANQNRRIFAANILGNPVIDTFLSPTVLLGYPWDDENEAQRQLKYKFQKDILQQMINDLTD